MKALVPDLASVLNGEEAAELWSLGLESCCFGASSSTRSPNLNLKEGNNTASIEPRWSRGVDQFLRKHSCSDCFFGVTSTCKRRKNARHSSCRKAVSRFCCYAPGGRSGEYRDLPFAKGRGTFLVMPMPESSMVKVELVLSGMISDAHLNKPQPLSEESRASILHRSPTRCMPRPTARNRNGPRSFDEEVGLRLQLRGISMHRFHDN